jgi:DNA polymerase III delta prime subunit
MATLVENGYQQSERRNMHPFFVSCRQQDQAYDSNNDSPRQTSHSPGEAYDETDLNQDRRKRRRITPVPDEVTVLSGASDDNAWMHELQCAASGGGPHGNGERAAVRSLSVSVEGVSEARMNLPPLAEVLQTSNGSGPAQVDGTEELRSTNIVPPSHNMLKLTRNGKLMKSTKPKSKEASPATPARKTRQTRNLTAKSGRITPSLCITIRYSNSEADYRDLGRRISVILAEEPNPIRVIEAPSHEAAHKTVVKPAKAVHPFFQGKVQPKQEASMAPVEAAAQETGQPQLRHIKSTVPWSQISFSSSKSSKPSDTGTVPAPWPPLESQRVEPHGIIPVPRPVREPDSRASKQKRETVRLLDDESILHTFAVDLQASMSALPPLAHPTRLQLSSEEILAAVDDGDDPKLSTSRRSNVRQRLLRARSAFDRGAACGPLDWARDYAPKTAEDVLQPDSLLLKNWLQQLQVHNVQSKITAKAREKKAAARKKRTKKRPDDLDDFLADSDENTEADGLSVKNAIIICGPHGCGKTASVYAVAEQLDFEVFEIHPGMRRTARDIFDKVGDMTHNHMIQSVATTQPSRASSIFDEDLAQSDNEKALPDPRQKSLAGFFGAKSAGGKPESKDVPLVAPKIDREHQQKQSVILFEEVDVLFEEDKTFWAGVQSLIATSKRPVVLTCNSLDNIPLAELTLHEILCYQSPEAEEAVQYLRYICAAEGHLLERDAVKSLYASNNGDFRATLTDLNFWCQMTVGSTMGGLDWIPTAQHPSGTHHATRIVSDGTYHTGLDLLPETSLSEENILGFAQNSLTFDILDWELARPYSTIPCNVSREEHFQSLERSASLADTHSSMDFMHEGVLPILSTTLSGATPACPFHVTRESIFNGLQQKNEPSKLPMDSLAATLQPLEHPKHQTFPPLTGRLAPSLDGHAFSIATDLAPFVRYVVDMDRRREKFRNDIDMSSQGSRRQRRTRAAIAAAEGGDIANTRVDRHFPKGLDFDAVMATGPTCAQYEVIVLQREESEATDISQASPAPVVID